MNASPLLALGFSLASFSALSIAAASSSSETSYSDAPSTQVVISDQTTKIKREPQKVYVESSDGTYSTEADGDHCFFHEAHNHIHCYESDPTDNPSYAPTSTKTVLVEEGRTYRSTRHHSHHHQRDPIATGIGVGLAIGIPLLVHNKYYDNRYRYKRHYNYRNNNYRNYNHRNYNHRNSYGYNRYGYKQYGKKRYSKNRYSSYGKRRDHRGYRY